MYLEEEGLLQYFQVKCLIKRFSNCNFIIIPKNSVVLKIVN